MAKELFRPKFSPPGMTYSDAKQAGLLRETETWWIRLRHQGRTIRESTKTTSFPKAKQFLSSRKASLARGEPFIPHSSAITFSDMAERIKRDYEVNGKHQATLDARLSNLKPFFGSRRLMDLRPDDIDSYIAARQEKRKNGDSVEHGGATNGTINRELEILARAFSLGRKLGLLTLSTLRVRNHRLAESSPRQGWFETKQFQSVLSHLTRAEVKDGKSVVVPAFDLQLAVTLMYVYGWRLNEVLNLERRHIRLDGASGLGTLSLDPGSTKNKDGRTVVLTPDVKRLLEGQLARLEAFQKATGKLSPYLFIHLSGRNRGERIQDFKRTWVSACRAAGVPGHLRHDFRRTAVRNMVNAGVPERVAMDISGHKTRSVFDRYHIVSESDHVEAARRMARVSSGQESDKETSFRVEKA